MTNEAVYIQPAALSLYLVVALGAGSPTQPKLDVTYGSEADLEEPAGPVGQAGAVPGQKQTLSE